MAGILPSALLLCRVNRRSTESEAFVITDHLKYSADLRSFSQVIKATPHKDRLSALYAICFLIFHHIAQKSVGKSGYASYTQALCGIALNY